MVLPRRFFCSIGCSGDAGGPRDAAGGGLACLLIGTYIFSVYKTRECIRLNAIFANAGAEGDDDGDTEALGLTGGWWMGGRFSKWVGQK